VPETNVWKFPKLDPVGVLKLVDPRPVKVIISALPMPPKNVTEFVPLPAQPPQVNTPEVENVTGSAFAATAVNARKQTQNNGSKTFLTRVFIYFSFVARSFESSAPNQQVSTPTFAAAKVRFSNHLSPGHSSRGYLSLSKLDGSR
jgi:hypothetical protein